MSMYRFTNDYSEAAHPDVLAALTATNLEGNFGYGLDGHCERAAACIRELCAAPDADEPAFTFGEEAPETEDAAYANERDYFDVAPEEDFLDPDSAPDDFGSLLLDLLREGI